MKVRLLVGSVLLSLMAACASGPEVRKQQARKMSAEQVFQKGLEAYHEEDWQAAADYFQLVKSKFPYSKFAADAELFLADCLFQKEKYLEAASAYEEFVKLHPNHLKVPYAMLQIGRCHYERIPQDWFLIPPAYELDQSETLVAIEKLREYLGRFPREAHAEEGRELLQECLHRMAERARYCLEFYRKRGFYRGVVLRADEILHQYPDTGFDEEALFRRAEAWLKLKEPERARKDLHLLLQRFPTGEYSESARRLQAKIAQEEQTGKTE